MIPIGDERRIYRTPVVTAVLLVSMTVVFLWQQRLDGFAAEQVVLAFGLNPAHLFGYRTPPPHLDFVPTAATLVTYAFLHGGWLHLLGNGLFLWVFGPAVEDAIGSLKFAGFFMLAAAVSGAVQGLALIEESRAHMIGASGAISGLVGIYLMLFPKARLVVLVPIYIVVFKRYRWPSMVFIGIWFSLQLGVALLFSSTAGNVAFLAHIGGFLCGVALAPILRRADVPLFGGR